MERITKTFEINAPVQKVYNQWTQFEEFPRFMDGVESIRQVDDTHLHWVAKVGGKREEFDAEVTEQTPDQRIAWNSTNGATHAGVVTFHRLDEDLTRIMLQLDIEPDGVVEKVGDALGVAKRQVKGDLERFKELIESRGGQETGAWRGEVPREG